MTILTSKTEHQPSSRFLQRPAGGLATCLALIAAMSMFPASLPAAEKGAPGKKPVLIFLLSGQSNMSGRGDLGDLNKPAAEQKATLVRYIKAPENVEK